MPSRLSLSELMASWRGGRRPHAEEPDSHSDLEAAPYQASSRLLQHALDSDDGEEDADAQSCGGQKRGKEQLCGSRQRNSGMRVRFSLLSRHDEDWWAGSSDSSDSEEDEQEEDVGAKALAAADAAAEADIVSSYYAIGHVRVPPPEFHVALRRFYAFFLLCGVPVKPMRHRKLRPSLQKVLPKQLLRERERMLTCGSAPVPMDREPRSQSDIDRGIYTRTWWHRIIAWQWILLSLSLVAVVVHITLPFLCAGSGRGRLLRVLFGLFEAGSWASSMLLARDVLSKRLIGTRIHYVNSHTRQGARVRRLVFSALRGAVITMLLCVALGITGDALSWPEMSRKFRWVHDQDHHAEGAGSASVLSRAFSAALLAMWCASSVVLRVQQFVGVACFSALMAIHLLRVDSCVRALKSPSTSVSSGNVQVFDIDVSLADLSYSMDPRVCMLLVSSFLTFFFQSVYIANWRPLVALGGGEGHDDSGSGSGSGSAHPERTAFGLLDELLTLLFHCFLCASILLAYSALNQSCHRLQIVALRFVSYQERQRLNALDLLASGTIGGGGSKPKEPEGGNDEGGSESKGEARGEDPSATIDQKKKNKKQEEEGSDGSRSQKQQKKLKQESAADPSSDVHVRDSKKRRKDADTKQKSEKEKGEEEEEEEEVAEESKSAPSPAPGPGASPDPATADPASRSAVLSSLPASEAVARSARDLDGDGDLDVADDLALLAERISSFTDYLRVAADLKMRLANMDVDSKVLWAFAVVVVSTLFSLLQIEHASIL